MKPFFAGLLGLALSLPLFAQAPSAGADAGTEAPLSAADQAFLDARAAFRAGDAAKLAALSGQVPQDYPLAAYLKYYALDMDIGKTPKRALAAFAEAQKGNWLGERVTADWQKEEATEGDWAMARRLYARLADPGQEARCIELLSREMLGDFTVKPESLALWLSLKNTSDGCRWFLEDQENRLDDARIWQRARYLLEEARTAQLKRLIGQRLPQQPQRRHRRGESTQWQVFADKPALWLARYAPKPSDKNLGGDLHELVVLAIGRMARADPAMAEEELGRWKALTKLDKEWLWSQIGLWGARYHKPLAEAAYARTGGFPLTEDAAEWRARAALRARDWPGLGKAIAGLPDDVASRPAWVYWQARALMAQGAKGNKDAAATARALFGHLAGNADFYGILAAEELGKPFALPPAPPAPTPAEMAEARANKGLQRAVKFFFLGLRPEGIREWNWTIRGMDDRHLLAAAHVALENRLYDRAINTAEKTLSEDDFSLRYLAPFEQEVTAAVERQGLDPAWVYGLMRQESRFILDARSSAGASGLMQLMPKTARWVARKIGLKDYDHGAVNDKEVNLLLGTSYMRMVMENLQGHPVLASAAYNAGPSRARRWKADSPLEAAIYIETIPFDETRGYVQKVMANTFIYRRMFKERPELSLKAMISTIPPKEAAPPPVPDLP